MTARLPRPDPSDKDAIRQWMKALRNSRVHGDRSVPDTPAEFAALQRKRLLESVDLPPENTGRRRLDLALTGAPTEHHIIQVSTLGPFLTNLQESVSAVAQALTGRPTNFASIPRDIREATTLSAVATFPSSFGVVIYGPPVEAAEDSLFPEHIGDLRTVLDDAVDTVLDIVDLSEGASQSNELLEEQLVPLGQRAMKHIGALTAGLTDAGVGLKVSWHTRSGQTRISQWSPAGVQRVHYLCEHSEFAQAETVTVTGWLGSASSFHGKVEIRTDSGEIIRASTDEEITSHLERYFNKRVEAEVEVTKVQSAGGRERRIYSVIRLRNLAP
ncbi:hypothetical protein ABZ307_05210 [Streptomyces griseorubiginosus]|uniref:hypothetical protein n=1 Tax=Streptomyces griseorubiginosus TaxID=67304 RepID=UPI0033A9451E